jgi:2,4-dichlorophenol 6-monooxygenase
MTNRESVPSETGVLIVGGGPVGLTASLLLSQQGIQNVVVERRQEHQRAPAAHVLRPRPMEIFDRVGAGDEIRRATPLKRLDFITWCATLGGAEVGRLDAHAGGPEGLGWTNCPQNLLEPILLRRAQGEAHARVLRGAEWTDVCQDEASVRAELRLADGSEASIEAPWMIAADGAGSPVRRRLDIPMVGPGPQGRFFMIHFEADLRPWIEGRSGPLFWIMNPESPGTLIVHDPARSFVFMTLRQGAGGEEDSLPARLAAALGVDVEPRILSIDAWSPHVQVAERYRDGRIFLAGDAAHRFPPTGGLGLNTGILDVDFLVHQLARVLAEGAESACLDLYEACCRPVAETNAGASFENLKRLAAIPRVLGPCADLATLEARLSALSPDERKQLEQAIELQRSHFASHGRLPRDPRTLHA